MGQLSSKPIGMRLSWRLDYWAFKQIEGGRSASDIIKDIVEGNECYAILGIALLLALETWETTETTLAIATCQRLWQHDMSRFVQEPHKDIDLFGLEFLSRLTGEKAAAKEFLDQRKSRKRDIRQFAMFFALSEDIARSARSSRWRSRGFLMICLMSLKSKNRATDLPLIEGRGRTMGGFGRS